MKKNKKQQGFTLVTVMILSSIAGVVVLSSLKDNTNQERLSGNFQKGLNARLVAEQGVYDTLAAGTVYLANTPNATQADIIANVVVPDGDNVLDGTSYAAEFVQNAAGQLTITSTGNRFESQAFITANVNLIAGAVNGPFQDAIVGCNGVDLAGSGGVNSYDSTDVNGVDVKYNNGIAGEEGDVTTINHNGADVTLGGNSPIFGDISATGNVDTATSSVTGNIHANGNVTLRSNQNSVTGNVRAGGDFIQSTSSIVGGNVRVNGNASSSNGSQIQNSQNDGLDILYGGSGNFVNEGDQANYGNPEFNIAPNVAAVSSDDPDAAGFDAANPDTSCDFLGITDVINNLDDGSQPLLRLDNGPNHANADFTIEPGGIVGLENILVENTEFLNGETEVIKLDSLSLTSGGSVNIQGGDVTLFVEGDFILGGSTRVVVADGSSLTLIVKGMVQLGHGADIIANNQGVVEAGSGLPAVSIYSSFDGDGQGTNAGVSISGSLSTYAAIYAPLTNVAIIQGGELLGAVRGKEVSVTGNAQIHYDESLRNANGGGGNGGRGAALSLLSFEY